MTKAQASLLMAAKDTLAWIERRHDPHYLPKGLYEEIGLVRQLYDAIGRVEHERDQEHSMDHDAREIA